MINGVSCIKDLGLNKQPNIYSELSKWNKEKKNSVFSMLLSNKRN